MRGFAGCMPFPYCGKSQQLISAGRVCASPGDGRARSPSYAESNKDCALTVTLNADGKTAVAGKLGTLKVSASGYADVRAIADGAIIADFATVVTSGKVKKMLTLRTNLWFGRKNAHEEGVGSAVFAE